MAYFFTKNIETMAFLQVGGSELGFDEVVDTLNDALDVTDDFSRALHDGAQYTDLLVVVNNFGRLKEIANDFPVFWAQLKDLDAQEADAVYDELAKRRGESLETVAGKAVAALRRVLRTYRFANYVLAEGEEILEDWKLFFGELKGKEDSESATA